MVKILPDEKSIAQAAAQIFLEQSQKSAIHGRPLSVVLSGGATPIPTYRLLTEPPFRQKVDWSRVHIFFSDERCVPVTDFRSNYKMARENFLDHVPIPAAQIHPFPFHQDSDLSAREYEILLKKHFGEAPPCFDLIFLGLGQDGHTASLFPDSLALQEKIRWTLPVRNKNESFDRITLTVPVLNQAEMIVFLVSGPSKTEILKRLLSAGRQAFPAKWIQPIHGQLLWLTDSAL